MSTEFERKRNTDSTTHHFDRQTLLKNRCMHNRLGVVCLKTNVVLGGVEATVTKRDNRVEGVSKSHKMAWRTL